MVDQKQRPTEESSRAQNIGSRQDAGTSEQNKKIQKQYRIEQNELYEKPLEELGSQIREELGAEEYCELVDSNADINGDIHMSKPFYDDDFYDFSEYEQDSPIADPDDDFLQSSMNEHGRIDKNDFDILSSDIDIDPAPDIIIDEFGCVEIGRENILEKYYAGSANKESGLSEKGQHIFSNAQVLRTIGEALVDDQDNLGNFLSRTDNDFSKLDSLTMTQKKFMGDLGIQDAALRSKIVSNCYIKTPYWGTFPLARFFPGRANQWKAPLEYLRWLIKNEDFKNPYKTSQLWKIIKEEFKMTLKDDKMLRNKQNEKGIPLTSPRKQIFTSLTKWRCQNNIKKVQYLQIDQIRLELMNHFDLFSKGQAQQCRQQHYTWFINERILYILKAENIEIIPNQPEFTYQGKTDDSKNI